MNLKTLYLIKKYSDTKWEEFKSKNIKLEHAKSTKFHYRVDKRFVLDDETHTDDHKEEKILTSNKDLKNFSQKEKILTDDQRFTQLKISAYK